MQFDINKIGPKFIANPHPTLHRLRAESPVHRNADGSVFVTRYDDVRAVYRSPAMSSDKTEEFGRKYGACPLRDHHTTSLVFRDPPDHTVVRKLLAAAFTPRKLAEMEPLIEGVVTGLLDRLEDLRAFDLIEAYAKVLPTEVISFMLGIPEDIRPKLRGYSLAILGALDPVVPPERMEAGNKAVTEFSDILRDLIAHRRANPEGAGQGEVLDGLIFGDHEGRRLTDEELIQNCIFLLNAGHETTTSFVGNAVGLLLDNPEQHRLLRDSPDMLDGTIEEVLRLESPLQIGNRMATEDVELGNQLVKRGTYIHTSIAAANRDPAVFDAPDVMNIARSPNRHLAFITGIHVCLGASLARLEGRIALGRLVQRFPDLRATAPRKTLPLARFRGIAEFPMEI